MARLPGVYYIPFERRVGDADIHKSCGIGLIFADLATPLDWLRCSESLGE